MLAEAGGVTSASGVRMLPSNCTDIAFDIGSNNGKDAERFLKSGFCVLTVDANPEMYNTTVARVATYAPRYLAINVGLTEHEPGHLTFYTTRTKVHSSFDRKKALLHDRRPREIRVPTMRCESLWSRVVRQPHIVKIDIEELHYVCVEALARLAPEQRPRYVTWEMHSFARDQPFPVVDAGLISLMAQLKYSRLKIVSNSNFGRRRGSGDSSAGRPERVKDVTTRSSEWRPVAEVCDT